MCGPLFPESNLLLSHIRLLISDANGLALRRHDDQQNHAGDQNSGNDAEPGIETAGQNRQPAKKRRVAPLNNPISLTVLRPTALSRLGLHSSRLLSEQKYAK